MKMAFVIFAGAFAGIALAATGGWEVAEPATGLATLAVSAAGWLEARRSRAQGGAPVSVFLEAPSGARVQLPLELVRRDLTRAELLGRIGMLPMREAGKRFSLRSLGSPATMRAINAISGGEGTELILPATEAEVEQFDL